MAAPPFPPANLSPRMFYGLRTDIQFNLHHLSDSEILYPVGGALVIYNILTKKQRFIRLVDKLKPIKSIVLSPNRQWLALNEISEPGQKPIITIYDLNTMKRRKILTVPFETTATEFACVQFTFDSKYIVAVTGDPDWYLYYYNWEKGKVESHAKAQNPSGLGTVATVQCNPTDATLIVITGPYTFRIMNVAETVWRQWGWSKAENINITASMWLTPDRIIIGTDRGKIMMVENGDLKQHCLFNAFDCLEMTMKKAALDDTEEDAKSGSIKVEGASEMSVTTIGAYPVTSMLNFAKGFVYCCGPGYVHMFEKETLHVWKKRNLYRVCRQSYKHLREYPLWSELDVVHHITVDPMQSKMLITTKRMQIYQVTLFGQHMLQNPEIPFTELTSPTHTGPITCLSLCAWKPIFLTAGLDQSLRLWNYVSEQVELIKIFQEEILSLALHPTGLFTIIGFADKLRFLVILIDDFEAMREFSIRNCKRCKFSTSGHLFAAVNGTIIQIFSTVSFLNVFNLKGHSDQITSLSWSANDGILASCGTEGAVYQWSLSNGQRVGEVILKSNKFAACAANNNGETVYAAGKDTEIKEISASAIRRNLPLLGYPINFMVLSRSDLMLFVTGGLGGVTAIQLPMLDKIVFNEYHMHNRPITGIGLSYDDQTLITVAEDSSVCIWKVTNPEGRAIDLDKDFSHAKEILISKRDLQEKIDNIKLLTTRMSEMETEANYHLRQTITAHEEKLKGVHEGYTDAIRELKGKNEKIENEHAHEIGMIHQEIAKVRLNHELALQNLEAEFNEKLIGEYDKYQILEDKTNRMRRDYEKRIEDLIESKEEAVKEINEKFLAQLDEKDVVISDLQEKAEIEIREHEVIKTAIEDDADREIVEVRQGYELQLKAEKDANVRLKGETGIMKKKLIAATKDIDEFKHQITQLKAEHVQLNKVIQGLDKDVTDLKKEMTERDTTIQEKESRIQTLKRKNHELEKYKFVLNFKINELKAQIEPKEREILELCEQIVDMEGEEFKLITNKKELELKLSQLVDKLEAAKKDFVKEVDRNISLQNTLRKIKIDLHNMSYNFQDPTKLKTSVKKLFHKYIEDADFIKSRAAEEEAVIEFNKQRDHLERQIASLKTQLTKVTGASRGDIGKLMEENCNLLSEINTLRNELKMMRTKSKEMESILGMSARYMTPSVARQKLRYVTEDRDTLDDKHKTDLAIKDEIIQALKDENERLLYKVRCMEMSANIPEKEAVVTFRKAQSKMTESVSTISEVSKSDTIKSGNADNLSSDDDDDM